MISNTSTQHWIDQSEINSYLLDVKKYDVLSRDDENELIKLIKQGDNKAKEKLIYSNLRFVIKMAKQYMNQGLDLADLISEGNYGLLKAAERFDYNQTEVRFLSYAVWWIKQCMLQSLHDNSRTIRLPVNIINELNQHRKEAPKEFYDDYDQIDKYYNLPSVIRLDGEIDDDGGSLHDVLEDVTVDRQDLKFTDDRKNLERRMGHVLSKLSHQERYVIVKYFGLDGEEPLTLQDISENLDLTKERVRQIKEKTIKRLRYFATELFELL